MQSSRLTYLRHVLCIARLGISTDRLQYEHWPNCDPCVGSYTVLALLVRSSIFFRSRELANY